MNGLIRYVAAAALRKLTESEPAAPTRLALPAPSSGLMRRPQRKSDPPMLRGTPVWPEPSQAMPPMVMPSAYPAPAPAPRPRRRKVTIFEETITRRRG